MSTIDFKLPRRFIALMFLSCASATTTYAQVENKALSDFMDKQAFPRTNLQKAEFADLGLLESKEGPLGDSFFNASGFSFSYADPYCKESALAGKFVHGEYSEKPVPRPSGAKVLRRITKMLAASSAEEVNIESELDKIAGRFTRAGMSAPRLRPGFGSVSYLIKHHNYPLAVSFQVQDRGCLILSASYNRYQSELSAGVDAKQQKAGQRLSDAIK